MLTVKWKNNVQLYCTDEEGNDWMDPIMENEEFDVHNIVVDIEDEDNGDIVSIYLEDGIVAIANSDWFEIVE